MTSRSVKTDQSLLHIDWCDRYGHDCSTTHDWITIDGTRNDQTLVYCTNY